MRKLVLSVVIGTCLFLFQNCGGNGGAIGQPGAAGAADSVYTTMYGAGAGGAAGAAIVRNGFNVTFSAGGGSPNLLGSIQ